MNGMMLRDECEVVDGAVAGGWIAHRLSSEFGLVRSHVPNDYEAYCRIFHPAWDLNGRPVRWGTVAEHFGRTMHKEAQWESLVRRTASRLILGGEMQGELTMTQHPIVGELDYDSLNALLGLIGTRSHQGTENCYFGLSIIEGWLDHFAEDELEPLLTLPNERTYIVMKGPLSPAVWRGIQSPNLIWADDQSWYAISDVDFDSTLFGGNQELVGGIIGHPFLEAWQVEPGDSLASDADMVN